MKARGSRKRPRKFASKRAETLALRNECPVRFRPLFDHLINLADDSNRQYEQATFSGKEFLARRAGQELARARKIARYT